MSDADPILDHPIIASRYFYPRAATLADPYWLDAADGSRLACVYQVVEPAAPTVVYFHGNGEVVADYVPDFPAWMTRAGFNLLLAEYRGYGMSNGRPALAGMLDDVPAILRQLAIADQRLVLFGRSIGSLYALHGAFKHPNIAGLILESGISAITERFFMRVRPEELGSSKDQLTAILNQHFDYTQKLRAFRGKTLILHTRHDELVPVRHAEALYAAASEPKQLHIFERGGHNDIFYYNQDAYRQLVETFVASV
jgi:fermentation-respiration switch protein FrsA (DUF1100 family)